MDMRVTPNILAIIALLILQRCGPNQRELEIKDREKKHKEFAEKCGCDGVHDCLGKYKFDCARTFYDRSEDVMGSTMQGIVIAEATYWVTNKDYERALTVVDETAGDAVYCISCGENEKFKIRFEILNKIIEKLIDEGNFHEAKKWAFKASDDRNNGGWTKEDGSHFNKNETQRYILLKKVDDAEELLK